MGSRATTMLLLSQQLPLLPSAVDRTLESKLRCKICYVKLPVFRTRGTLRDHITERCLKGICSRQNAVRTHVGVWEDPSDGSESEYDSEEQNAEDTDIDFESDWEEEKETVVAKADVLQTEISYEDQLEKEIEQVLGPEERIILEQNQFPNLKKISTSKWSPLHTLALSGQIHFLDQLLENGVHIDSLDKDGRTALHVSVMGKKEAVISHLLRKGANPHVKDKDGVTPLHCAVQVGAMQSVKLLVKYNVDVNISDNEGWTPLHIAMQTRNRDFAKVLLVNGADKNRKNKDGKTPFDLSLAYGKDFKSYDLTKLLKIVSANRDL